MHKPYLDIHTYIHTHTHIYLDKKPYMKEFNPERMLQGIQHRQLQWTTSALATASI